MRLDTFLVQNGYVASRARAQAAVKAGAVSVDGRVAVKPSQPVGEDAEITIAGAAENFVSRGAVKLNAALRAFGIDAGRKICLDLGASTGGFTEALLLAGAAKVYAVDVGTGQLHPSLASDPRVVNLERTHAKTLDRSLVPDEIGLLVCDVSFISLMKALPPALALCAPQATIAALVKPQFELGPAAIGKGGIVRAEKAEIDRLLRTVEDWFAHEGWRVAGVIDSPIAGGDGNREYLLAALR